MTKAQSVTITFGPAQAKTGKIHNVRAVGSRYVMTCTGRAMGSMVPVSDATAVTCKSCAAKGA